MSVSIICIWHPEILRAKEAGVDGVFGATFLGVILKPRFPLASRARLLRMYCNILLSGLLDPLKIQLVKLNGKCS